MTEPRPHRRPAFMMPVDMEAYGGTVPDPAEVTEIAHATAGVIVGTGRAAHDPDVTAKLVALVDELGLATVAELWADRPARSLPGALWRLYALREWVQRSPHQASGEYAEGMRFADVSHAVAGAAEPPGPQELQDLTDAILRGVFEGDLAVALERAAAFCSVVSTGRAHLAHDALDEAEGSRQTQRAASMQTTGQDLLACARMWRGDTLS